MNIFVHFYLLKTYQTVYRWFYVYTFSPAMYEDTSCSAFLPPLVIARCFFFFISFSHSKLRSGLSSWFLFLVCNGWWCWTSPYVFICHLLRSPVIKCLFKSHAIWKQTACFLWICLTVLSSFDMSPLSDVWFATIFSKHFLVFSFP